MLLILIGASLFLFSCGNQRNNSVHQDSTELFIDEKSAIGTEKDPAARKNYEYMMLRDPNSDRIPVSIRKKEYNYTRSLPSRREINENNRARSTSVYEASEWIPRGPFNIGGRTRALKIDISNENIILAGGVSGGMWRSEDNGLNWSKTTNPGSIHSVTCLSQDERPGKENTWYYGTGELQGNSARGGDAPFRGDGLFKSTDGGNTWAQISSTAEADPFKFTSQFQYVWNVITNPANETEDEVFAAIYGAIVRSTDGGENWDVVLGEDFLKQGTDLNQTAIPYYTDIATDGEGNYFATLSKFAIFNRNSTINGVYYSSNGNDWINITPGIWPENFKRTVVGIAPSNPNVAYFISNSEPYRLMKFEILSNSPLSGRWTDLSLNLPSFGGSVGDYDSQDSYNMVIKVHPEDENVVFLGGTNLYRSTNGFSHSDGTSWIGGYDTANDQSIYPKHYVDQHAIDFYPSDGNKMITGNDGGVQITNNNLRSYVEWDDLNNGYITAQFYTIGINRYQTDDEIFGGLQDNGSYAGDSKSLTSDWRRIIGGDGGYCDVTKDGLFYFFSFQEGQVYRMTFGDRFQLTSFARIDPAGAGSIEGQELIFVNPFVLDSHNNNLMYFAGGDRIWRNLNLSQIPGGSQDQTSINWEVLRRTNINSGSISALNISYLPANTLYYGTSFGDFYKVENANTEQYQVSEITGSGFPANGYISTIAIDHSDGNHLLVGFSNYNLQSIYASFDGGGSFEPVGGNLEENPDGSGNGPSIRWLEIMPLENENYLYFAGTSTGVYSTNRLEGMNTIWAREGEDVIGNVVVTMLRYRPTDGTLVVATHGNGAYSRQYENVLPFAENPATGDFNVSQNYPNPFSDQTTITYTIPEDGLVNVSIVNSLGQNVHTLINTYQYAGTNYIKWNGKNGYGADLPQGMYFYQIRYQGKTQTKRLILSR